MVVSCRSPLRTVPQRTLDDTARGLNAAAPHTYPQFIYLVPCLECIYTAQESPSTPKKGYLRKDTPLKYLIFSDRICKLLIRKYFRLGIRGI